MARHKRKPAEQKRIPSPIEQARYNRLAQVRAIEQNLGTVSVLKSAMDTASSRRLVPPMTILAYGVWEETHLADCIHDGVVAATEKRQLGQPEWLNVPQGDEVINAALQHSGDAALSLSVIVHPIIVTQGVPLPLVREG